MDTDAVKAQVKAIQERIQNAAREPPTAQSELEKRQAWRDLEILKMDLDASAKSITTEARQEFDDLHKELTKMASLRAHARTGSPVLGAIRFGAFFFMVTLLFPLFVAAFPLRWMHPLLRKLGVKNNRLPYDYLPRLWGKWSLLIFGIQARVEGWENVRHFAEDGTSTIGMFQHSSFLDFMVVMGGTNILFKWVSKKSLYFLPMVGQMGYMAGMIPIDRSNFASAKRSLDHAAYVAQHYKRGIAIAPEGTRSTTGQLQEFKKGAFHLALQCGVDATPLVFFGAFHLWPPSSLVPSPGVVTLRFLKPIKTADYLPDRYNDLLRDVRVAMLNSLAEPPRETAPHTTTAYSVLSGATVAGTYALTAAVGWLLWKAFH